MTQDELIKIIKIVSTHTEEEGGVYCDTGDDMNWHCRSECTSQAVHRLNSAFIKGEI
jgi:hypothetical protein